MLPSTQAIFDEHANPTHCGKREVHDLAAPTLAMVVTVQQQVAVHRRLLMANKYAPHDHAVDGKLKRIQDDVTTIDKLSHEAISAIERLGDAFTKLERDVTEVKTDIDRYEAGSKGHV